MNIYCVANKVYSGAQLKVKGNVEQRGRARRGCSERERNESKKRPSVGRRLPAVGKPASGPAVAPSGCKFTLMLAQDASGQEVQVTPDGPCMMSGVPIKSRGGGQEPPTTGGSRRSAGHRHHHHQTAAASLLTLSLVGLVTSVLAAAATVLVTQSVDVVLRLPISANLGE